MAWHLKLWQKLNANTSWAHIIPSGKIDKLHLKTSAVLPNHSQLPLDVSQPMCSNRRMFSKLLQENFFKGSTQLFSWQQCLYQKPLLPFCWCSTGFADGVHILRSFHFTWSNKSGSPLSPYDQTIPLALYSTWPNFSYFFLKMSDQNISFYHKLLWVYIIIFIRSFRTLSTQASYG